MYLLIVYPVFVSITTVNNQIEHLKVTDYVKDIDDPNTSAVFKTLVKASSRSSWKSFLAIFMLLLLSVLGFIFFRNLRLDMWCLSVLFLLYDHFRGLRIWDEEGEEVCSSGSLLF